MLKLKSTFNIPKLRPMLDSDEMLMISRAFALASKLATCDFEGKRVLTFIINNIASYVFLGVSFYIALALDLALHIILIIPLLVKDVIAPDFDGKTSAKLPLLSKLNLKKICILIMFTIANLAMYIFFVRVLYSLKGLQDKKWAEEYKDYTHEDAADDYYKVLGVQITASIKDIKKAYHLRAGECHPDKNIGAEAADRAIKEAGFKKVSIAHYFLTSVSQSRRAHYNGWLHSRRHVGL